MTTVAIVVENPTVRDSLQAILSLYQDYRCVGAWKPVEKEMDSLVARSPEVILIDAELDGVVAVRCTGWLKRRLPAANILVLIVYEDPDLVLRALQAGASAYLLKRSNPGQTIAAIARVRRAGPMPAQESINRANPALLKTPHLGS
jgi:DNA-binding NarL/FixJ family response regulator